MKPIRVLLVEDMELLRTALVSLLSKEDDIEVIADLRGDQHIVAAALRLRPDVAVVCAGLRVNKGLSTVLELRKLLPECQVVVLVVKRSVKLVERLLAAGVSGLIDKNAPAPWLLHAIRGVADGGTVIDANLVIEVLSTSRNPFTPREVHVLQLAASGASGPEIAKRLSLSPGTVRNYISNAMSKAGARTRIDAIRIATESGWL